MRSLFVTFPLVILGFLASISPVRAQVSSDGSLSTSVTSPDGANFTIDNGDRAGGNLFHSFSQFSVPTGGSAVFQNPVDVQNIISRVTGGSISNIDGLIRTQGNANLFLLNPAGIFFGPNARLNIGGSFFGTTANSLLFPDGVEFSAANLQAPPLLSVNIPIGLRFRDNPAGIQIQGNGQGLRSTNDLIDTTNALRVEPNQTLAFVGGDLSLEGATLKTAGGRIELGSVAEQGQVSLTPINKGFSLGYDAAPNLGNIQLSKQTAVDASGDSGGDVQVVGQRVTLTDGSQIEASTLGSQIGSSGGSILVNAPGLLDISGTYTDGSRFFRSGLVTDVYKGVKGKGGNINITTGSLFVTGGAEISSTLSGEGNAGKVTIDAKDKVQIAGTDQYGKNSHIISNVESSGIGNGGEISITAGSLFVSGGGQLSSDTIGKGNAGNITIKAPTGTVSFDGKNNQGNPSGVFSNVGNSQGVKAEGKVGNISIEAREVTLTNGSELQAGFYSNTKGNPGTISIRAEDKVSFQNSNIFADVYPDAVGDGSNIDISAKLVSISDGALLDTRNRGQGNAGNITVNAQDTVFLDGGTLRTRFSGTSGQAGNIDITTGSLFVSNGGQLTSSTFGKGNAGNITIKAPTGTVSFEGKDSEGNFSGIFSSVNETGVGSGGDISITAGSLLVNQGLLSSRFFGSSGQAGNIDITTGSLFVSNGGQLTSSTFGKGNAGNITIKA
ncbi:MAG: filamentous hemagglutinin N-terminal domain-containing protein, partial [Fischerella sp.]|nr:filamentous hemagglutinin N-terminal domain-containing protein [Fischerella sp.]